MAINTDPQPTPFSLILSPDPPATTLALSHRGFLLAVYSVVLVSGAIGVSLAVHILQSNMRSVTTVAVLNLVFAHLLFLLTVPLRIYYYATMDWGLGPSLCKLASSMIHIHMYLAFVLYVVILVTRLLAFYGKAEPVEFYQKLHALGASLVVWVLVLVAVPCILHYSYGKEKKGGPDGGHPTPRHSSNRTSCFRYGNRLREEKHARVFNYIASSVIVAVACALTGLQAFVLVLLRRKYGQECTAQQVFWAQLKSFFFALVMLVCFVPYHMFRLHYVTNVEGLEERNEVFLSLTALCCFDMLTFMRRNPCCVCDRRTA
ncbi:putative G-protein coupled receptor 141 [Aplochiton taeniatus]